MTNAHRITGKKKIKLSDFDPNDRADLNRAAGEARLGELMEELKKLQELLYAAGDHSLLIILQGIDTSGKDGTIRAVTGPLNSQSCRVASFKVPTLKEKSHDFLWRVHQETPGLGEITIFNRSHYEDVLVVRVHNYVPVKIWRARYAHINAFEKLLKDANTIVLKFYLHISREEQEKRLLAREEDPTKAWKLAVADWQERELWDQYIKAYEGAINHCSTPDAPWFIVPANRKWFRNLAVAEVLVEALKPYEKGWLKRLNQMGELERKSLEEFRRTKS